MEHLPCLPYIHLAKCQSPDRLTEPQLVMVHWLYNERQSLNSYPRSSIETP